MVSSRVASSIATPSDSGSGTPSVYRLPPCAGGALRLASSPAITAARADAINQYGLASEAPLRSSIRVADGSASISERTAALRLSRLHVTVAGANESGVNRR